MTNSTGDVSTNFGWLDYTAFGLMVALSTVVGGLIGVCAKQNTKVDYLLGGRSMKVVPVAVSLVFSKLSSISLIGIPTEIYTHGTQYYATMFSLIIASIIYTYVFLPVFFELKLTSTYEYLELRFNKHIRFLVSLIYDISMFLYLPVINYVAALTFNQVSGMDMHLMALIVSVTCIFYTMLGGLKAVVWTDFLQSFVTVGSCVIIVIIGVFHVGGIGEVFRRNNEGGRLELFNLDPSPFTRNTFWTVTLGTTYGFLYFMVACQGMVQKIIALPDVHRARKSIAGYCIVSIFMKSAVTMVGLTIYATYYECDPISAKNVRKADQVVPYFVMDTAGSIPGLPGLFIAGIFSAAMSSMSSNLNCISATVYEDILIPCFKGRRYLERNDYIVLRIIVILFGVICAAMVYVVDHLGAIFDLANTLAGVTTGAFLGIYCLGMVFPWANVKGAMVGTITSMIVCTWIVIGAGKAVADGRLTYPYLPMYTDACSHYNGTLTASETMSSGNSTARAGEVFILYRVSYLLYTFLGALVVLIIGLPVSWVTGSNDPRRVDRRLIVPFMQRFAADPVSPAEEEERLNQHSQYQDCSI